jgi:hypothetical protein
MKPLEARDHGLQISLTYGVNAAHLILYLKPSLELWGMRAIVQEKNIGD